MNFGKQKRQSSEQTNKWKRTNNINLTLTSVIFERNASDKCRLRLWLSAAAMKSEKNSCGPGKDGRGHTPDIRDGAVSRSCSLTLRQSSIIINFVSGTIASLSKLTKIFRRKKVGKGVYSWCSWTQFTAHCKNVKVLHLYSAASAVLCVTDRTGGVQRSFS